MTADGSNGDLEAHVARQVLWRFVNDRIFELEERRSANGVLGDAAWARCECGRSDCEQLLAVAESEYASVRSVPTRFIVAPGHELGGFERVVMDGEGFVVVELFGRAAKAAASDRTP